MSDTPELAGVEPLATETPVAAAVENGAAPVETKEATENADQQAEEASEKKRLSGSQRSKAKIAELQAEVARLTAATNAGKEAKAPALDDYDGDWDKFQAARDAHIAEQAAHKVLSAERQNRVTELEQQRAAEMQSAYAEQVKAAKATYADFDAVVRSAAELTVQRHVVEAIQATDDVASIQYHLAKNPTLLAELNALPPMSAARRLGQIEAEISRNEPKQSKAPPPVGSVKGGASPKISPSSMSFKEFKDWREKGGTIG